MILFAVRSGRIATVFIATLSPAARMRGRGIEKRTLRAKPGSTPGVAAIFF